jgi:hypothetical protein
MPSIFRVVASSAAASSAAALMLHLCSKPAHTEQNRPAQNLAVPDVADKNSAFSEGFVGMVGNTPLVNLLFALSVGSFDLLTAFSI